MKVRIVKRTNNSGKERFVIQKKFLFWWFDIGGESFYAVYSTLEKAKEHLHYFDGSKDTETIISN